MEQVLNPFDFFTLPFGDWCEAALDYIVSQWRATLLAAKAPVQSFLNLTRNGLLAIPPTVTLLVVAAFGYWLSGWRLALVGLACLGGIGLIGAWEEAMTTLSIVLAAVSICVLIGMPIGILAARSDRFFKFLRPVLDMMQTVPSFVYLVPVVMLFGIGDAPGVIVTCLFAISPLIRLTNLGIREVREDLVESARAFGASELKVLFAIQMPLARPTILAGLNQSVLLSLTMAVVASMISVAGLGRMVLEGIGRLDFGGAAVGGLGIVMTAIFVDRYTQALGASGSRESKESREGKQ